jgi:dTDP-L-rhamnose 4-epimerase
MAGPLRKGDACPQTAHIAGRLGHLASDAALRPSRPRPDRRGAAVILVTGGAGFVGSHVVDRLVADGAEVRVLDLRDAGRGDADVVVGDLRDPDTVERALHGVDAVSHQAGMVGLGTDFDDVADYVAHNDLGTAVLLRALARARFQGRLVLASSMVVYGEGRYRCRAHGLVRPAPRGAADLAAARFEPPCPRCGRPLGPEAIPEDAALDPRNVYAATKLQQEHLAAAFAREHPGASVTVLRYHNIFGPRMPRDTPYAGVASIFQSALAAGHAPRVYEDGRQRRDFVHAEDVARANALALDPDQPAGTYNVASGKPRTVLDLARALAAGTGIEPVITGEFRLGDVRHVFASTERCKRELGFRASVSFDAGMRELVRA